MGLLGQVIGNVINSRLGGRQSGMGGGLGGMLGGSIGGDPTGGMAGASSPLVMALMALLGSGAMGGGGGGGPGGLLGGATDGGSGGGLGGLLERFQQTGHGEIANSWVGDGENQPIAPHQLNEALGPDIVGRLSQQTGLPQGDLLQQLSHVLPDIVHGVTPDGRMPNEAEASRW